ncbi:MAG: hypothetical protein II789_03930 [Clostridia bacterium]|nr:hypothetical protein [Clostridia bacterium]
MCSAFPPDPIRGHDHTLDVVGRTFLIRSAAVITRSMWSDAPFCLIRGRDHTLDVIGRTFLIRSAAGSRRPLRILAHFFEAGCFDF